MTDAREITVTASPADHFRTLSNPPARLPLPAALSKTVSYKDIDELSAAVRRGIESHGLSVDAVSRLTVAWPHKHPRENHHNAATQHVAPLCDALAQAFPEKSILRADALYETKHLGRSENSTMLFTLTARHGFDADPALQTEPLPFLTDHGAQGEVFVLTDWISVYGTTLVNFVDFLAHNGGVVAALALPYGGKAMRQTPGLEPDFQYILPSPGVPQTGQIPLLAATFQRAARGTDYTQGECVALFDRALALHGHRLANLTDGEAQSLYTEIYRGYTDFPGFVEQLGISRPLQNEFVHNLRRSGGPR